MPEGRHGSLTIFRDAGAVRETFLHIDANGGVTAFHGHVDLGTGLRTAVTQIVAEELDVPPSQVSVVMGDTHRTPNQGPTIASESIQIAVIPLRQAAAQARAIIVAQAALLLQCKPDELAIVDGMVVQKATHGSIPIGHIVANDTVEVHLDPAVAVKAVSDYKIVGMPMPRVDIPAKATGQFVYVHDVRIEGMLHGHVVRPPYAGRDSGGFIGHSLLGIDEAAVSGLPGFVAVVVIGDFIGVVAEREEQARAIAEALPVRWCLPPDLPDLGDVAAAIKSQPATRRELLNQGDVERALEESARPLKRRYTWPWQMHGSIGPSCAIADWRDGRLTIWSGTQNPHMLRGDLATLMQLDVAAIEVRRFEAAGCYGRNCADDVCGDAALLSRAVGCPVRVQLTREQEHLWEPKGAGQLIEVEGAIDAAGDFHAYDFNTWYPSNRGPNLALLLTGMIDPSPRPDDMGDRTAIPPYNARHMRIAVHDMAPIVRASWMRGVSAMPNCFAHESFIDEMASEAGEDPVEYRLRHLRDDPRAAELIRRTAEAAGWQKRSGPRRISDGNISFGQGFAYATYIHGTFPGVAAAKAAWVAEVAVNRDTGEVSLARVMVGQDAGLMINPDGVRHQIEGNVAQSASRVMTEAVTFDTISVAARDWGSYPIMKFPQTPPTETLLIRRDDQPPLGAGEASSVPSAAAIANAIFDATGVRMCDVPFTPERVKAALAGEEPFRKLPSPPAMSSPQRRGWMPTLGAALAGGLITAAVGLSWHGAIPRETSSASPMFSDAAIARGKELFALGNCSVCHTAEGGTANAGGRPMATPFGTVYSTNLTSDSKTGMGGWTYPAFVRAMRNGIGRDGRHLYPAFPYTSFARLTEPDMQALFAYIQTLEPVHQPTPAAQMVFPVAMRAVMAAWNLAFHDPVAYQPDPTRSELWNRGAYFVNGIAHCGACHTPRNLAGAEQTGAASLSGAMIDGWEAPALNGTGRSPLRWTEADFYDYLRTGVSARHGAAAGPMAPVVEQLANVSDSDIRAMAIYLASLAGDAPDPRSPQEIEAKAASAVATGTSAAARMFDTACAACHVSGPITLASAAQTSLAFASSVHADRPDTFLRVILDGLKASPVIKLNDMPAFGNVLGDQEIIDLANYVRGKLAPDKPRWVDLDQALARARAHVPTH